MDRKRKLCLYVYTLLLFVTFASHAAPPHPRLFQQRLDRALKPMLNAMSPSLATLRDPDIPKADYEPQPDGVEYILAIRIDFSDQLGHKPAAVFNEAIFGTRSTSVRLYFEEVSYGQMNVRAGYLGGVMPPGERWYRAREKMSFYGEGNIMPERYTALAREACEAADPEVDFSKYDRDGDGYVDHLMLIHAGDDEASTGISKDIWSAVVDAVPGTYDGVQISSVMMVAEDPGLNIINIGIYCHEFFHEFGAPDLYAWDFPVGHWGLMGNFGPYQDNGQHPSHISGYLKWDFDADRLNGTTGWLEPVDLTYSGDYSLDSFELPEGNRLCKIDIPGKTGREYFLLENRNKRSGAKYDTYIPESGVVIWHIDESQPKFFSNPRRAWVEDPSDPERADFTRSTQGAAYSADDGQTSFTPATIPDSSANDGTYSGIIIADIGLEGMSMPFTLFYGDTYEPNDSIAEAYGPLTYGEKYMSFILDDREVDFFNFHADSDANILVYLEDIPENADYDLRIFDTLENLLADSTGQPQTSKVLNFKARDPGIYYIEVSSTSGHSSTKPYILIVDSVILAPGEMIAISKAYPNPAGKDGVWFKYTMVTPAEGVTLDIYGPNGRLIYNHELSPVNVTGEIFWDATNDAGKKVASGIYIYALRASLNGGTDIKTGKLAIVY